MPWLLRARRLDGAGPQTVSSLRAGESGIVASIVPAAPERVVKLSSLGVMPGVRVTLVQRTPAVVLRIGESTIALDGEVAEGILVESADAVTPGTRRTEPAPRD